MGKRTNSDGGSLFDAPYTPPVRVSLLQRYEARECRELLQKLRNADDPEVLRNVLSVACLGLTDTQAQTVCDLLLKLLAQEE